MLPLMSPSSIAFDVGPLAGRRTGVGRAVAAMLEALQADDQVELMQYLTSFRAPRLTNQIRLPYPASLAHRAWARFELPRADRFLAPAQLIHGTNYVVPPSRLPRVVSVYDCWFLHHPDQARPAVRRAGRVLLRSLRSGAVAHTSSLATADSLRTIVPDAQIRTVKLAALELSEPPSQCPLLELKGVPFVVSIATLEKRKNLTALVAAFAEVAAIHHDLQLVLAGADGDDRGAIDAAIDQLPAAAARRVLITGFIDDERRSWLVHHARVVAYPSLDEGFGFPLLDAMRAGTPIVASTAGSIPEIVGDAALLVAPGDVVGLAQALDRALVDDDERRRLASAGIHRLQSFSWSKTAAQLAALYADVIGGNA